MKADSVLADFEKVLAGKPLQQKITLAPHAPYSVSNELWQLLMPHFTGNTVSIHNQETPAENELFKNGTGNFIGMYEVMNIDQTHFTPTRKSSLQSYFAKMSTAKNILLVHNTELNAQDLLFANTQALQFENNVYWCVCANANLYIENCLPPIDLLRRYNCSITIGTDSLASNHSLSILDELKIIAINFPEIPLHELLQWATLNGAEALQMNDRLGSFESGKKPGVLLISGLENNELNKSTKVRRLV